MKKQPSKRPSSVIPNNPVYRMNGKLQPAEFTAGVQAFCDLFDRIRDASGKRCGQPHDRQAAETLAPGLSAQLSKGGAQGQGFCAALIEWMAIRRHSDPGGCGHPLHISPFSPDDADDEFFVPDPHSLFFDVAGAAVAVTEDLYGYSFNAMGYKETIGLDLVRAIGKPITREQFDALRTKHKSVESQENHDDDGTALDEPVGVATGGLTISNSRAIVSHLVEVVNSLCAAHHVLDLASESEDSREELDTILLDSLRSCAKRVDACVAHLDPVFKSDCFQDELSTSEA